jgi:hypothetical protein
MLEGVMRLRIDPGGLMIGPERPVSRAMLVLQLALASSP